MNEYFLHQLANHSLVAQAIIAFIAMAPMDRNEGASSLKLACVAHSFISVLMLPNTMKFAGLAEAVQWVDLVLLNNCVHAICSAAEELCAIITPERVLVCWLFCSAMLIKTAAIYFLVKWINITKNAT